MSWLPGFVWGLFPWWVWLVLGGVAAVTAYRLLGWKGALGVAAVTLGLTLHRRGEQVGEASARAKQKEADDKARDTIKDHKIAVPKLPPDQRDEEFKSWSKH